MRHAEVLRGDAVDVVADPPVCDVGSECEGLFNGIRIFANEGFDERK